MKKFILSFILIIMAITSDASAFLSMRVYDKIENLQNLNSKYIRDYLFTSPRPPEGYDKKTEYDLIEDSLTVRYEEYYERVEGNGEREKGIVYYIRFKDSERAKIFKSLLEVADETSTSLSLATSLDLSPEKEDNFISLEEEFLKLFDPKLGTGFFIVLSELNQIFPSAESFTEQLYIFKNEYSQIKKNRNLEFERVKSLIKKEFVDCLEGRTLSERVKDKFRRSYNKSCRFNSYKEVELTSEVRKNNPYPLILDYLIKD